MDSSAGSHRYPFTQSEAVRGKSIFQARVTENFGDRYTIETVIDGKPLHGIIFSCKPSTLPVTFYSSSRRRAYGDPSTVMKNGDYNCESKASKSIQPDSVANGQADDMHGKEASSQEPHAEPDGPDLVSNVSQPFDGSNLEKAPIESKDDQMDGTPNLNAELMKESVSSSTKDSDLISEKNHLCC